MQFPRPFEKHGNYQAIVYALDIFRNIIYIFYISP